MLHSTVPRTPILVPSNPSWIATPACSVSQVSILHPNPFTSILYLYPLPSPFTDGDPNFVELYAETAWKATLNEKNTQIRELRLAWLSNAHPAYAIVRTPPSFSHDFTHHHH